MTRKKTPTLSLPVIQLPILATLPPAQRLFVTLMARGLTQQDAAKLLGKSIRTCGRWQHLPWYQPTLDALHLDLQNSIISTFAPMLPAAIQAYEQNLKKLHPALAQDVMDRLFGKPIQRQELASTQAIFITFTPYIPPTLEEVPLRVLQPERSEDVPPQLLDNYPLSLENHQDLGQDSGENHLVSGRHSLSATPDSPCGEPVPQLGKGIK